MAAPSDVHVIATDDPNTTRADIERAVLLASSRQASVVVWIPRPITHRAGDEAPVPHLVDGYKQLISALGGRGRVRVCLAHDLTRLAASLAQL